MKEKSLGISQSLVGATMWGASSVAINSLFSITAIPYIVLLFFRLLLSSLILFVFIRPHFNKRSLLSISIFGVIGLFAAQLTYLAAIYYSNATTATVLQYLFMPMVVIYDLLRKNRPTTLILVISITFSFFGLILLSVNFYSTGSLFVVSPIGLFFGLMAAVSGAFYTIYARVLVKKEGFEPTISLGFLFACIPVTIFGLYPSIRYISTLSAMPLGSILTIAGLILFVVIVGTVGAFYLYIKSMKHINSSDASVTASMEPISAAIFSVLILDIFLTGIQYLGAAIIILSIFFIQIDSSRNR
jgi:drug/metabolite transporter (DMT)-like permease